MDSGGRSPGYLINLLWILIPINPITIANNALTPTPTISIILLDGSGGSSFVNTSVKFA
jgi:hypothetical protein